MLNWFKARQKAEEKVKEMTIKDAIDECGAHHIAQAFEVFVTEANKVIDEIKQHALVSQSIKNDQQEMKKAILQLTTLVKKLIVAGMLCESFQQDNEELINKLISTTLTVIKPTHDKVD